MSNFVFQASHISSAVSNNHFPFHSLKLRSPPSSVTLVKIWRPLPHIKCSLEIPNPITEPDGSEFSKSILERCFQGPSSPPTSCSSYSDPFMKGGKKRGSFSVQTIVQKEKLDSKSKKKAGPEVEFEGGGGDIGKKIFHGGGDGGDDDGGDDDDYYDEFEDDDGGEAGGFFRKKKLFKEIFDRKFVDSVLEEWQKTMRDIPTGFRQAYEMGLISSAQMVRILSIHARPTITRAISRSLPTSISREFIGRMLADPAFLYKLLLEQATSIGFTLWLEMANRKENFRKEWDLVLLNVLTVTACNAFVVWSLAPCRSYGTAFRSDLQNTIQKLPNNVFERSYPLRDFNLQKRIHSLFFKSAELSLVGMTFGALQGTLSNFIASRKENLAVTVPSLSTSALGYGAFLGVYANFRYQSLCGLDHALVNRFDVLGVTLCLSTALRVLNSYVGEKSRLGWLGVEGEMMEDRRGHYRNVQRNWFGSKMGEGEECAPKSRRKRIVRKKVDLEAMAV